jgi:hypothetical protein
MDKHSSLLRTFVIYGHKSFIKLVLDQIPEARRPEILLERCQCPGPNVIKLFMAVIYEFL